MFTLDEYAEACVRFAAATRNFYTLSEYHFYTTRDYPESNAYGGMVDMTVDNAHDGLDVTWSFHQSEEYIDANVREHYLDEVRNINPLFE